MKRLLILLFAIFSAFAAFSQGPYKYIDLDDYTPLTFRNGRLFHDNNHLYARLNGVTYQLDQQGGISGTGSANRIPYWTSTTDLSFGPYWDNTNSRLGIGATPSFDLDIVRNTSSPVVSRLRNTGTGELDVILSRSGGTASEWAVYLPTGSTDLRVYNGGDKFTFTNAGVFKILTTPSTDNTATPLAIDGSGNVVRKTDLIDGSGASGRVSYYSDANTVTSSPDFTFSSSRVDIGATNGGGQLFVSTVSDIVPYMGLWANDGLGDVSLIGRTNTGSGGGTNVFRISAGDQGNAAHSNGTPIAIKGGNAFTGSGNGSGGDLTLTPGNKRASGSGSDGDIRLVLNQANGGYLIITNLPTSSAGLPSGAIWNDGGTLKIAP